MQIVLNGKVVPKKNSKNVFYKNGRMFVLPSTRFVEWHKNAEQQIKQLDENVCFDSPCHVDIQFYHSDNRRRDSDNLLSSIFDLLVDTNVLSDDSTKIVKSFTVKNVKANEDKTVISIYKMEWLS